MHNLGVQIQRRHKRQICRQTARDLQWTKRDEVGRLPAFNFGIGSVIFNLRG
jgi:hypothetical protein